MCAFLLPQLRDDKATLSQEEVQKRTSKATSTSPTSSSDGGAHTPTSIPLFVFLTLPFRRPEQKASRCVGIGGVGRNVI